MLVAALDCGTSAIKAGVVDLRGRTRAVATRECPCVSGPGQHIEIEPATLEAAACACLRKAVERSRVRPANIAALAITNQRATLICCDRAGEPLGRGISWQDLRGAGEVEAFRRRLSDREYYRLTGLPHHAVFTLAKLLWLKKHAAGCFRRAGRFVLIHDYLLRRLGAADFFTDWSNASLTGLLDVARLRWSGAILELAGLDEAKLPKLVAPGTPVGVLSREAARRTGLLQGTLLVAGGGDQQCAGLGAGAVQPGILEITLGTAGAPLCYAETPARDPHRRVTCCAHAAPGKWEVEGLQNSAGASLRWLRDILDGPQRFVDHFFAHVAQVPPGAGGVRFYPYLTGAAAPHWDARAKAAFLGLTASTDRYALARAVLEGVSLETREILEVIASLRIPIDEVRLTGGCTRIELWNQVQADLYGKPVSTLETPHATLLGAALLAACGAGAFATVQDAARSMVRLRRTYRPRAESVRAYQQVYHHFVETGRALRNRGLFATVTPKE